MSFSLTNLCNLCYCATRVVTEECRVFLSAPWLYKSPPIRKIRIISRLKRYKRDLNWLHELCIGKLLSHSKVDVLTTKYNLNIWSIEKACEEVQQTVKVLSCRLKCYRYKRSCRQQNGLCFHLTNTGFINSWWAILPHMTFLLLMRL